MKYRTIIILAIIAVSALIITLGWRPTSAAFQKIVHNLQLTNGLVGYWSFDGNYTNWALTSAEARDSSGSGNHGDVTNFGQEAVRLGVSGQALSFDGSNDRVVLTNTIIGNDYSYSAWVKINILPTNGNAVVIFNSGNAANGDQNLWILNNVSGLNGWALSSYSDLGADTASEGSLTAQRDVWYFVVGVRNSSDDSARVYVNGTQVAVDSDLTSATALYGSTGVATNIGMRVGGTNFFNGIIDEVRVYNRALSVAEIAYLYNRTAPDVLRGVTKRANNTGLVGFWNFDDADAGTTVNDMSGSGNLGTMYTTCSTTAGSLHTTAGKIGNGANLDGSNDCIEVDALLNDISGATQGAITFWAKLDLDNAAQNLPFSISNDGSATRTEVFIDFDARTGAAGDRFHANLTVDGTEQWDIGTAADSLDQYVGQWVHIALVHEGTTPILYVNGIQQTVTFVSSLNKTKWFKAILTDATTDSTAANMGLIELNGSDLVPFDGSIDEARIYNRALSATEVKSLFEDTKRLFVNMPQNDQLTDGLIGLWSFNGPDVSGTTAYDRSGKGNNGTLTSGPTVAPGIVGQGLNFDGSNDYVTMGDNVSNAIWTSVSTAFSTSLWVKPAQSGDEISDSQYLISKDPSSGVTNRLFYFAVAASLDTFYAAVVSSNGATTSDCAGVTPQRGTWYHVVLTYNTTNGCVLYVNGVSQNTDATTPALTTGNSEDTEIGSINGGTFTWGGLIDEPRIYNRTLTAAEVAQIYKSARRE